MSYCKIHNSPIGGVCSDINCPSTVMCMQCVASSNSCVRTKNHQFVPLDEFIDTYFLWRKKRITERPKMEVIIGKQNPSASAAPVEDADAEEIT